MLGQERNGWSEKRLQAHVTEICGRYGKVRHVKVYIDRHGRTLRPLALVYMESPEDTRKVAGALGANTVGPCVLISLRPENPVLAGPLPGTESLAS